MELPFAIGGNPKPVVLVGGNGSGKTNLLSIITDALFEAAAAHYQNVVPVSTQSRPWFRFVGASTVSVGAPGGFAILQFEHDGAIHFFKEKAGRVLAGDAAARLPESLRSAATWPEEGSIKEFTIADEQARKIFEDGVYVYFPSSRAEIPYWFNRDSVAATEFDLATRISKHLRKPIYVEEALDRFQQWLMSVVVEARHDILVELKVVDGKPQQDIRLIGNPTASFASGQVLGLANIILRKILGEENLRFVWLGRRSGQKIGIATNNEIKVPTLSGLSAGQATLLGIFGTILRYADNDKWKGALPANEITGVCIIDEIDAHMHVDLQFRALPELIQLFPKIQFIVSSHSPLFALGMEKSFGADGIAIIDMPSGVPVEAEAYAEFGRALLALQETRAFAAAIAKQAATPGKLLVLLEGETDPIYLSAAVELLDRKIIIDNVEFAWVGAKDPKGGQSFHTGKDALNHTLALLRAKPQLAKRSVLLLYDNDANKESEDHDAVSVRSMPSNAENSVIGAGIENLLPNSVFTSDMFITEEKKKANGTKVTTTTLDKMRLCKHLCEKKRDTSDFEKFSSVLDLIEALIKSAADITPALPP